MFFLFPRTGGALAPVPTRLVLSGVPSLLLKHRDEMLAGMRPVGLPQLDFHVPLETRQFIRNRVYLPVVKTRHTHTETCTHAHSAHTEVHAHTRGHAHAHRYTCTGVLSLPRAQALGLCGAGCRVQGAHCRATGMPTSTIAGRSSKCPVRCTDACGGCFQRPRTSQAPPPPTDVTGTHSTAWLLTRVQERKQTSLKCSHVATCARTF